MGFFIKRIWETLKDRKDFYSTYTGKVFLKKEAKEKISQLSNIMSFLFMFAVSASMVEGSIRLMSGYFWTGFCMLLVTLAYFSVTVEVFGKEVFNG